MVLDNSNSFRDREIKRDTLSAWHDFKKAVTNRSHLSHCYPDSGIQAGQSGARGRTWFSILVCMIMKYGFRKRRKRKLYAFIRVTHQNIHAEKQTPIVRTPSCTHTRTHTHTEMQDGGGALPVKIEPQVLALSVSVRCNDGRVTTARLCANIVKFTC